MSFVLQRFSKIYLKVHLWERGCAANHMDSTLASYLGPVTSVQMPVSVNDNFFMFSSALTNRRLPIFLIQINF